MSDSFVPEVRDFTGADRILQGTDWKREHTFTVGGVVRDMSEFQPGFGGSVRGAVKSEDLATTYFQTSDLSMRLTWIGPSTLEVGTTAGATAAATAPLPAATRYQIEATSGITGRTERILQGRAEMDTEVVKAST